MSPAHAIFAENCRYGRCIGARGLDTERSHGFTWFARDAEVPRDKNRLSARILGTKTKRCKKTNKPVLTMSHGVSQRSSCRFLSNIFFFCCWLCLLFDLSPTLVFLRRRVLADAQLFELYDLCDAPHVGRFAIKTFSFRSRLLLMESL